MVEPKSRKKTISIDYPEVCSEWNYAKNNGLTPEMFTAGSNQVVWWVCKNGHEWKASIAKRIKRGQGCPYCSGHRVKKGFNDLSTLYPSIAAEWHPKNNGELFPTMLTAGSNKKVWWLCPKCGYEWVAKVVNRTNGRGCPNCGAKTRVSNYRATISGKRGTLEELAPVFLSEWDTEKNTELTPNMITAGSNTKIWWLCDQGHSWQATVYDRMNGVRCPVCYKQHRTSLAEQAIYYYVHKKYEDAENGFTGFFRNSMELDIYIPSIKVGIEYDGAAWHSSKESLSREKKKYEICKKEGVRLLVHRITKDPPAFW